MFWRLVTAQAIHKWPITTLLCIALTTVVSLHVYLNNSARFSNRSMQLIMKNLGCNLIILPRKSDPLKHYACSPDQTLFEKEACVRMAKHHKLASKYYTNVLQRQLPIGSTDAVLTGIAPVYRGDESKEKGHLVSPIAPDSVELGSSLAQRLCMKPGDSLEIKGKTFKVTRIRPAAGTMDDCRAWIDLHTCQKLLGMPGKVNAIYSFLCMHGHNTLKGILDYQNLEFDKAFPEFQVIPKMDILLGRHLARKTTDRYLRYLLMLVLSITVVLIIVTGLQEVTERKHEVGILLAMGAGYPYILFLYIAKLLALAVAASIAGFLIGSNLSKGLLASVLVTNTRPVDILWQQLPNTILLTCGVVLAAAIIPLAKLVRTNPNTVLAEE